MRFMSPFPPAVALGVAEGFCFFHYASAHDIGYENHTHLDFARRAPESGLDHYSVFHCLAILQHPPHPILPTTVYAVTGQERRSCTVRPIAMMSDETFISSSGSRGDTDGPMGESVTTTSYSALFLANQMTISFL